MRLPWENPTKNQKKSPPFVLPPGFRSAHFCSSWLTGDWWGRRPEELQFYFTVLDGIPLLGFSKANRRPDGITVKGRRPHKLQQSTKPFYYDISNPTHLEAFLRTMRHLVAFSAGLAATPHKKPYSLDFNDSKQLCRTELDTTGIYDPKRPDRYVEKTFEILEVRCEYVYDKNAPEKGLCSYAGNQYKSERSSYRRKSRIPTKRKNYFFRINYRGIYKRKN